MAFSIGALVFDDLTGAVALRQQQRAIVPQVTPCVF